MSEPRGARVELLRPADDVAVVQASGELDFYSTPAFEECVSCAVDGDASCIAIDLTETTFINSTAIGVLVGARRRSARNGVDLAIVCPAGNVARIIERAGLSRAFAMYDTRAEALGTRSDEVPQ